MFKKLLIFCLYFFVSVCDSLLGLSLGGLTAVDTYTILQTFPQNDSDNEIVGFAWLKAGFSFEDSSTSMTFRGVFPQAGPINLYGGFLTLESNLVMGGTSTMPTFGSVFGGGYILDLAPSITQISASTKGDLINDLNLMLSSDLTLSGLLTVRGSCLIDGRGHDFTLNNVASLIVDANSTLTLRNMTIKNQYGGKIQLNNSAISFCLDKCSFDLNENYKISQEGIVLKA